MNMKKPLALLLAAGMTLGLAACGNGSQGNSESPAPGGETGGTSTGAVELNLWAFNIGGFTDASNWDSIIAAFNEQNPDVKITVTPINYQDGDLAASQNEHERRGSQLPPSHAPHDLRLHAGDLRIHAHLQRHQAPP